MLPGDEDADGISVWANDLTLNGGSIRLSTGTVSARLRLTSTSTITNSAAHKVDGSQGVSGIEAVVLNRPAVGDAYERGENIDVTLAFSEGLHIIGLPQVALNIGTATRPGGLRPRTGQRGAPGVPLHGDGGRAQTRRCSATPTSAAKPSRSPSPSTAW